MVGGGGGPRTNAVPWAKKPAAAAAPPKPAAAAPPPKPESSDDSDESESDDDDSGSDDDTGSEDDGEASSSRSLEGEPPEGTPTVDWYRRWKADTKVGREAERKREAALINVEPAERYSRPESVWRVLAAPNVRLLRASFLIELAQNGGVLQRRQDLIEKAFLPLVELRAIHAEASSLLTGFDGALPIVAVSSCWQSQFHADPFGAQLRTVGHLLSAEVAKYRASTADGGVGFSEVGVFWDWGSLFQTDPEDGKNGKLTPTERVAFEGALADMDLWFGHMGIVSLLVTRPPPPPPPKESTKGLRKKARTYDASGWTHYESAAARLKLWCRERRHLQGGSWDLVVCPGPDRGKLVTSIWPLVPPAHFDKALSSRSFARAEGDSSRCAALYRTQCASQLGGLASLALRGDDGLTVGVAEAKLLGECVAICPRLAEVHLTDLNLLGFGDGALDALCVALSVGAALAGPLSNRISRLSLDGNALSDKGAGALSDAATRGALRGLKQLSLARNRVGCKGLMALAKASRKRGTLPHLSVLNMYHNALGADPAEWDDLGDQLRLGAFSSLTSLFLGANNLGTVGCTALAAACLDEDLEDDLRPLAKLQRLHLYGNAIGHAGAIALGRALHEWALRSCGELVLDGNHVNRRATRFVSDALKRREWARVTLRQWRFVVVEGQRKFGLQAEQRRKLLLPTIASVYVTSQVQ